VVAALIERSVHVPEWIRLAAIGRRTRTASAPHGPVGVPKRWFSMSR
jgi:hypothetical protein